MDAFEQIASRLFEADGYWTRIGYYVNLTKEERVKLGKASLPRPQIDIVAYKPSTNTLLMIECKSFLDSRGVMRDGFHGEANAEKDVYKLFNRPELRNAVTTALVAQLRSEGLISRGEPKVRLALVAAKVYANDEPALRSIFKENGWGFYGPAQVAEALRKFEKRGYENDVATIVTKILERNPAQS